MARADNSRLEAQLRAVDEKMMRAVSKVTRRLALEAYIGVVTASPVDTGRFRGNWLPGVGDRPSGTSERTDPSPQGSPPAGDLFSAASQVIGKQDPVRPRTIYVVNNLPYARRLEDGYSRQAPAGMVAVTVASLRAAGRNVVARALLGDD